MHISDALRTDSRYFATMNMNPKFTAFELKETEFLFYEDKS